MDHQRLLAMLRCPETHQELRVADPELIRQLNARVAQGVLKNRAGRVVEEALEAGLVRADGQFLYPMRHGIPVMLVDEALSLDQITTVGATRGREQ